MQFSCSGEQLPSGKYIRVVSALQFSAKGANTVHIGIVKRFCQAIFSRNTRLIIVKRDQGGQGALRMCIGCGGSSSPAGILLQYV